MDIDETHDEYDGIYDGIDDYREEIIHGLEVILDEMAVLEHKLNCYIYNKGYDIAPNNHGTMLNAEDVPIENVEFENKFQKIYGDLYNLQKGL